jgi:hypothetical protein
MFTKSLNKMLLETDESALKNGDRDEEPTNSSEKQNEEENNNLLIEDRIDKPLLLEPPRES